MIFFFPILGLLACPLTVPPAYGFNKRSPITHILLILEHEHFPTVERTLTHCCIATISPLKRILSVSLRGGEAG
ncbi:hypothetical protein GGR57DRAFT_480034 [Xylariaceae sp. FL1272]|nr:hypothetical protein GGR57DRAFT_480034 [Xylariaceae sp. FL1272]